MNLLNCAKCGLAAAGLCSHWFHEQQADAALEQTQVEKTEKAKQIQVAKTEKARLSDDTH